MEVGNVFGTAEAENLSGQASARLLEGIEHILRGLQQRELRQGDGAGEFSEAGSLLGNAAQQMDDLAQQPAFPNIFFDGAQQQLLASRLNPSDPVEAPLINAPDLRSAYAGLANATRVLEGTTTQLAGQANAFRVVRRPISQVLWLADTIVVVQNR